MTKSDLFKLLENEAKIYRKKCIKSIKRNKYMNKYDGEKIKQSTIDAILVDFINFIAIGQGCDLGLYTHYLKDKK